MANLDVSIYKTRIITTQDDSTVFKYVSGNGSVYVNGKTLTANDGSILSNSIMGYHIVYFMDSSTDQPTIIETNDSSTTYTYNPVTSSNPSLRNKMSLKKTNMMIDDDTSYALLRVNPKLTGNVKVVVNSNSDMYLDTFKVSVGLSQIKYRHIPINPNEYYGRTLMAKMKSLTSDDFYKIEDSCYELFGSANNLDEQYYDTYNYGVRTNTDKMYSENFSLLAPLCVKKNLPDFFLIFKINNYEDLMDSSAKIADRTSFIDLDKCTLIKSYDFRENSKLGTYVRNILEHNKSYVGDVFTGYDYNHDNIYNGISLDRGIVAKIYESTAPERKVNNQVSMNDWYTLGFQRNRIVSKDIINFEFMFDDISEPLFSLPTYFGIYVKMNDDGSTFTCIDVDASGINILDSSVSGEEFEPTDYPKVIYGISTPFEFERLSQNIKYAYEVRLNKLRKYNNIINVNANNANDSDNINKLFASVKLNDVLDPGEHYRIIDTTNKQIYEVIASNYFSDKKLSNISYDELTINDVVYDIQRISILNIDYRTNISDEDKPELIKEQIKVITEAFNSFDTTNIQSYNDNINCFSVVYNNIYIPDGEFLLFEKVPSICGYNNINVEEINDDYVDKSSYIFGVEFDGKTNQTIIDPNGNNFETSLYHRLLYPYGFESLGTRIAYCTQFFRIKPENEESAIVLIDQDINDILSLYETIIYTSQAYGNKQFTKNVNVNYAVINTYGNIEIKHSENQYCITGFGETPAYLTKFDYIPRIVKDKVSLYQNYPMSSGICSILPLRDYDFDVLDKNSVFFIKNKNNPNDSSTVNGRISEYENTDINVFNKNIINKSEELIADYCDKFRAYNIDNANGCMVLNDDYDLGNFLSNMQDNGHTRFDISLISPYCCKWKLLGTDSTGNRMRVMYNLTNPFVSKHTQHDSDCVVGVLQPDGTISPDANYITSTFIDISQRKNISIKCTDIDSSTYIYGIGYYDSNLETSIPLSVETENNGIVKELIEESYFIRIIFNKNIDAVVTISRGTANTPYLIDSSSYWIQGKSGIEDNNHIGFLSNSLLSEYPKYISDLYDDETGTFNEYMYYDNGDIDELLYDVNNYENKFSKVYAYGENSIEFVSCGIKIRLSSSNKSLVNLSDYVGYSVILIAMSGNNSRQDGTYEIFVDETKEQMAIIVYNGISSEYNSIETINIQPNGIYRIKHSTPITKAEYNNEEVRIQDDGFLHDIIDSSTYIDSSKWDMILVSKPIKNTKEEPVNKPEQKILVGQIARFEDNYIVLGNNNIYCINDASVIPVDSQSIINGLGTETDNVDAYIVTTNLDLGSLIARNTLTYEQLKELTKSYSISIKKVDNTIKIKNTSDVLSIDIVDPFELEREDSNYNIITTGYVHPSYAVPVMKDIFKFKYSDDVISAISNKFDMCFDGCNILMNDVGTINQTWLEKVIDINSISKDSSMEATTYSTKYTIEQVPLDSSSYFVDLPIIDSSYYPAKKNGSTYTKINGSSLFNIISVKGITKSVNYYTINDNELVTPPSEMYNEWIYNNGTSDITINDFDLDYINDNMSKDSSGYYNGKLRFTDYNKNISIGTTVCFKTTILKCDASLYYESSYINEHFKYDTELRINENYGPYSGSIIPILKAYFDGISEEDGSTFIRLRTNASDDTINRAIREGSKITIRTPNYLENVAHINKTVCYKDSSSSLIHFTINNIESKPAGTIKSYIEIESNSVNNKLYSDSSNGGFLINLVENKVIRYKNAKMVYSPPNQTSSVTLLRDKDPLLGYWYTDMCRIFGEYDTYISYYGAFSGYEKNNMIASRGVTLKSISNNTIVDNIVISDWYGVVRKKHDITLDITESIIQCINGNSNYGYSTAWGNLISKIDPKYKEYQIKYIENTLLKMIDINNNTDVVFYVDEKSSVLGFMEKKPTDMSNYKIIDNINNEIITSNGRYYMNITDLDPHTYYLEMTIKL